MNKLTVTMLLGALLSGACARSSRPSAATMKTSPARISLFDGATLNGWNGNPAIWSMKDGALHGITDSGGQLILTDGDDADFRLIFKSRLLSDWSRREFRWATQQPAASMPAELSVQICYRP